MNSSFYFNNRINSIILFLFLFVNNFKLLKTQLNYGDQSDNNTTLVDSNINNGLILNDQNEPPVAEKLSSSSKGHYKRVCVYPNWSIERESKIARILPEDIDPFLCTHIHYCYAYIDVKNFQLRPSQLEDYNKGSHGGVILIFESYLFRNIQNNNLIFSHSTNE
jgi:hypothetical protein